MSVKNEGIYGWKDEYEKQWKAARAEAKRLFEMKGFKVGDIVVITEKGKQIKKGEIICFVPWEVDSNKWSSRNFEARILLTEGQTQNINGRESSHSHENITLEMIESGAVQMVKEKNVIGDDLEPDELAEFVGELEKRT